jgi:RNA-directed DNA polymerase
MTAKRKRLPTKDSRLSRLEDCYLYAIASPADLANRLDLTVAKLERLAHDSRAYNIWTNEKGRKIQEPKPELQQIHGRVHRLLSRVETPDYLHSSVRGRSYITNARQHISDGPCAKLDLKKFFPSVTRHVIFQFFYHRMRCARDVAGLLSRLLSCDSRLPTGSRASSILAYYCYKEMFDELCALAVQRGLVFTCYVDDVAFTGVGASKVIADARKIIAAYGMRSHKVKAFPKGRPRIVTGILVTASGVKLPNRRHLKIKAEYEAFREARSDEERLKLLPSLISRVHEAAQIDPSSWQPKARNLEQARRDAEFRLKLRMNSVRKLSPPQGDAARDV